MKSLKNLVMGIAVCAMIIAISGSACAGMGHGACKDGKMDKAMCTAHIKTLNDSAAALQASNPALAKGLSDIANKKAEMMQKCQEWKDKHDAKMALLKDSVAALKISNPALAKELQKMSEMKHTDKAGEMMECGK